MTSTPSPGRALARPAAVSEAALSEFADLERFWPSRRGHAFDEFCR